MRNDFTFMRCLRIEQLADRIALHSGEMEVDSTLLYTPDGLAYYYDPPVDAEFSPKIDPGKGGGTSSLLDVPKYHSNPTFPKKIYLDFDGHSATGTSWNNRVFKGTYNTGATISAPAFSLDSDLLNYSLAELAAIQEVWARVAEDYAPFQVDVTTEAPSASVFTAGSQAMRVVITTDFDATTGQQWYANAGGVAFLNSWISTNGSPCWVFYNRLASFPKYIAEAASHEAGHTLNLSHDGRISPSESYYQGHGSGVTGWAPIMGVGYYKNLTQWSKGDYTSANNTQDDLAIINSKLPNIVDDHGDANATATQLNVGTSSTLSASGLITTRTDVDAFRFSTQAGSITLNANPFDYSTSKANLDAKMTLLNSSGVVVASADNVNTINSTITVSVPKGYYTLLVDGFARPAIPGDDGYADYASLGKYTVSGTIVPNAAPAVVNDTALIAPAASLLIDVLANDSDANNDTLSIASVGTPSTGTAVVEAGKIRYTAGTTLGPVVFSYTVIDEFGVSATGNVNVNITANSTIAARSIFFNNATGTNLSSAGAADNAIASDKSPLLPGNASTFANYTNYARGLNGVIVDINGLPASTTDSQILASLQFAQWNGIDIAGFAVLPSVAVPTAKILAGSGSGGSARVKITFPDNTLQNTWLRVTVLANASTALAANDVFYFGNVIGDLDFGNTATRLRVNGQDAALLLANQSPGANSTGATNKFDLDRNGRVDGQDYALLLANQRAAGIVAPIASPSGRSETWFRSSFDIGYGPIPFELPSSLKKERKLDSIWEALDAYLAGFSPQ